MGGHWHPRVVSRKDWPNRVALRGKGGALPRGPRPVTPEVSPQDAQGGETPQEAETPRGAAGTGGGQSQLPPFPCPWQPAPAAWNRARGVEGGGQEEGVGGLPPGGSQRPARFEARGFQERFPGTCGTPESRGRALSRASWGACLVGCLLEIL